MEQVGLEAIFKDAGFQAGLKQFENGVNSASQSSAEGANVITRLGGVMQGALVVGIGAATAAIAAFVAAGKTGLETTLEWGESLDKLKDQFGLNAKTADIWASAMSAAGVPVDEGAQQLNFFTRGLAETTKTAKDGSKTLTPFGEALNKLGISALNSKGKLKTFDEVMPEILTAFEKLPEGVDASNLAMDLFGARGGSKMLDFLRKGNVLLKSAEKRIDQYGGMTDEQTDAVEDFGVATREVQDIIRRLWMNIGKELLPVLKRFLDFVKQNILPILSKWAQDVTPAITAALDDLSKWIDNQLIPALQQLWKWVKDNIIPILVRFANWVVDNVVPALQEFAQWIEKEVVPELEDLWDYINKYVIPILGQFANWVLDVVLPALGDLVEWIRRDVIPVLGEMYRWIKDNIIPIIVQFAGWVRDDLGPALQRLGDWIKNDVIPALQSFGDWIRSAIQAVQSFISWINNLWNSFVNLAANLLTIGNQIYYAITHPWETAIAFIRNIDLAGVASSILLAAYNTINGWATSIWNVLTGMFTSAISYLTEHDWWGDIWGIMKAIWDAISAWSDYIFRAIYDPFSNAIDQIRHLLGLSGSGITRGVTFIGAAGTIPSANAPTSTTNNYYNMTIHSSAPTSSVVSDFGIMRALAGA